MGITEQLSEPLLAIDDLAAYLRVPSKTIRGWRLRRAGPPVIKVGRALRYRASDVERWLEEHTVSSLAEPDGLAAVVDERAGEGVASVTPDPISALAPGSLRPYERPTDHDPSSV